MRRVQCAGRCCHRPGATDACLRGSKQFFESLHRRQGLLLLLQVADQLSLGLSRQLVEQGVLGELLLQGQRLSWQSLKKRRTQILFRPV